MFVHLLVIRRGADATGLLWDDHHWARPWGYRVLDAAGGEEFVQHRVHVLCGRGIDAVGLSRDRRAARGKRYLKGELGAGAKMGYRLREHIRELSQDVAQLGDEGWRPTEPAQFKYHCAHVRRQAVPYL